MAITYKFATTEPQEVPVEEKVIAATQQISETKEVRFTIKEKLAELEQAKKAVTDAQAGVATILSEINAIKSALKVTLTV